MAVLWQDTCRDSQRLGKSRCVTVNNKVNKTTVQTIRSNRNEFNKGHHAVIWVSIWEELLSSN